MRAPRGHRLHASGSLPRTGALQKAKRQMCILSVCQQGLQVLVRSADRIHASSPVRFQREVEIGVGGLMCKTEEHVQTFRSPVAFRLPFRVRAKLRLGTDCRRPICVEGDDPAKRPNQSL